MKDRLMFDFAASLSQGFLFGNDACLKFVAGSSILRLKGPLSRTCI